MLSERMIFEQVPPVVHEVSTVHMQIMELLGPSLWDTWRENAQCLNTEFAACVAVEALNILRKLHSRGWAPLLLTALASCSLLPVFPCISGPRQRSPSRVESTW